MRIDRLDLIAFGSFTEKSLDLSEGNSGLHIIFGNNEAGKSTSLRALTAWLFGIQTRTTDNYIHANNQLRIGGKLRLSNDKTLEFIRRKGTKSTLLDPETDNSLDDLVLQPFLPNGIDENLFTKLYGINHERLISGGRELLSQSGDLGQALFSAAVGTAELRDILSDLQNSSDELYKPRASTKLVNQAVSNFKTARKLIKELSLPVAEWKKMQDELDDISSEIEIVENEINGAGKEKSRIDRFNRVKGALAERYTVLDRIKKVGDVLLLPDDFDEERKTAATLITHNSEAKAKAQAKLSRLEKDLKTLEIRSELLDNEDTIGAIFKELGAVERALADRPQQDGKRRLMRNQAELLLKSVRPDLDITETDSLRPLINNRKWIGGLSKQYSLLDQKKEQAAAALRNHQEKQKVILAKLANFTQSKQDITGLKAAVTTARKAGDVETRLAESLKRSQDEKTNCLNDFSRLGRFKGDLEALTHISMPVPETLDTFEKQADILTDTKKEGERKLKELEEELKQAEQNLKTLLSAADIPSTESLNKTRLARNRGWTLIKKKFIDHEDAEQEILSFCSDAALIPLYEQKIESSDNIADQLRLAADQVAKRAELELKIDHFTALISDIKAEIQKIIIAEEQHQKDWHGLWQQFSIDPGTPREMKQWLLRVENLIVSITSVNTVTAGAKKLQEELNGLKLIVSEELSKFENATSPATMSLEGILTMSEQRIEQENTILEQKRQLQQVLSNTEESIKKAEDDLESVKNDNNSWTIDWTKAITGLGLKSDIHPDQATETFEQLLEFFDKFDKSEDLRKRIYGIDQVAERFAGKVFDFADNIGYEKNNHEAAFLATQINNDLKKALEAQASIKEIQNHHRDTKEEIENTDISISAAQQKLSSLKKIAGVIRDDELESASNRSREMLRLRQQFDALELELTRNGDGLLIADLEKEAASVDINEVEGELVRITEELKELQKRRDTLRDEKQIITGRIKRQDGSAQAAEASADAEQQLANIVSGTEQYLRLKIASLILTQQIEAYRKKNQAPILARSSELFSRLTLHSYTNLRDELDEKGKPILLGVRQNNIEVPVEGMSEGTRDQLFLSLRLAALEQHLGTGEPMPFVVDDILIGFDDERTKVSLDILGELAENTQVLLFTHHRKVLELANEIKTKSGIFIHDLK